MVFHEPLLNVVQGSINMNSVKPGKGQKFDKSASSEKILDHNELAPTKNSDRETLEYRRKLELRSRDSREGSRVNRSGTEHQIF